MKNFLNLLIWYRHLWLILSIIRYNLCNGRYIKIISQSTVKFHITNILEKMRVTTRSEAIVLATKNNLV
ncbi:MAG: LuxR C-terminal-related transcriptional regulator [Anaerolineae bacterium]|nr:LuxR C-terminal-related transcriptional regulator [Anaerolineae bacterium]